MKPYYTCRPGNHQRGCCCPGHDGCEGIKKWVGTYRSRRSIKAVRDAKRLQARHTRRALKAGIVRLDVEA